MADAPPTLQRLLLKVQPYDFMVKYILCKDIALADAFSRVNPHGEIKEKGLNDDIHELTPCMKQGQKSKVHEKEKYVTPQLLIQQML